MSENKPNKEQIGELTKQIERDQAKTSPAEKRVRINTSFKEAVKKIARTPPPKNEAK
jgi:hypothetical protein